MNKTKNNNNDNNNINNNKIEKLSEKEKLWLRKCLPVIVQPKHDINHGHGLECIFAEFTQNNECYINHIYLGEASYNKSKPTTLNSIGTWLYRSYNYYMFRRTADINTLVYKNINLDIIENNNDNNQSLPWQSIWTPDHAGTQTWSQGDKRNLLWYSFDYHYDIEHHYNEWNIHENHRPLLYLNTNNHLCGNNDLNPNLTKYYWSSYPLLVGSRHDAERYAKQVIPIKHNAFYWLPSHSGPIDEWIKHHIL